MSERDEKYLDSSNPNFELFDITQAGNWFIKHATENNGYTTIASWLFELNHTRQTVYEISCLMAQITK